HTGGPRRVLPAGRIGEPWGGHRRRLKRFRGRQRGSRLAADSGWLARGALAAGRLELGFHPVAAGAIGILVLLVLVESEARLDHLEPDEGDRQGRQDPPP